MRKHTLLVVLVLLAGLIGGSGMASGQEKEHKGPFGRQPGPQITFICSTSVGATCAKVANYSSRTLYVSGNTCDGCSVATFALPANRHSTDYIYDVDEFFATTTLKTYYFGNTIQVGPYQAIRLSDATIAYCYDDSSTGGVQCWIWPLP